jgi:hypothetical protein
MRNFVDTRHALYVGWVAGVAMRHNLAFEPVLDENGEFTDRLIYGVRPGLTFTVVVPPPPDDWELTDGR